MKSKMKLPTLPNRAQLRALLHTTKLHILRRDPYHVNRRVERRQLASYRKTYLENGRKHPENGTFKTPAEFGHSHARNTSSMDIYPASSSPNVSDAIAGSDPEIEAAVDARFLDPSGVDPPTMNRPTTSMLTDNPYVYVVRAYDPHATDPHATHPHVTVPSATDPPTARRDSFVEGSFSVASSEARVDCMAVEMSKDVVKGSRKVLQRCNAVTGNAVRAAKNWHGEYVTRR
jgi:hypothetical protein